MKCSTSAVSSAAISDLVSRENRAVAFGILIAVFKTGYCVSAGIAGFFTRMQLIQMSTLLVIARFLWSVFMFPETLPEAKRSRKPRRKCRNPIRGMAILCRSSLFIRLTILIAVTSFVSSGIMQIAMFYLNTTIGFDEKDTSHLMLAIGVTSIIAQGILFKPLMSCGKEKGVILVSLVARIMDFSLYIAGAYYPKKWLIMLSSIPSSVSDLSFAAIASLKSINCSEQEQGKLQGAIYSARSLFDAAGPVVFAYLYRSMVKSQPWSQALPFIISIGMLLIAFGIALILPTSSRSASSEKLFSPMPNTVLSPSLATSGGTVDMNYDDDDDEEEEEDVEKALDDILSEPLLGENNNTNHGVEV